MELIPINDSKLKIMLDESDMRELNICDEADCANNETRNAIRTILDRAKSQIGFNTEGHEIFVQLYTSRKGGCELFVTKGTSSNFSEGDHEKKAKKREIAQKKPIKDETAAVCQSNCPVAEKIGGIYNMVFSFDSLGDLCAVCRILKKQSIDFISSAYLDNEKRYYIILENTNMSPYTRLDRLSFLHEYGKRERTEYIITYLNEHGRLICKDRAIKVLSEF